MHYERIPKDISGRYEILHVWKISLWRTPDFYNYYRDQPTLGRLAFGKWYKRSTTEQASLSFFFFIKHTHNFMPSQCIPQIPLHSPVPAQLGIRARTKSGWHSDSIEKERRRLVQRNTSKDRPHWPIPRLLRPKLPAGMTEAYTLEVWDIILVHKLWWEQVL